MIFLGNLNSTPAVAVEDLGTQRRELLIQVDQADLESGEKVELEDLIMDLQDRMVYQIQVLVVADLQDLHNQGMADTVPTAQ
jgi:hypothetical protein